MKKIALCLLSLLLATPAEAATDHISFGGGGFNTTKSRDRRSADFRLEYRSGYSLLPTSFDPYVQLRPSAGLEANTQGAVFANAGFNLDIPIMRHGIVTWGETVGAFNQGNDPRPMGSILQFRSQIEVGVRTDNDVRVTAFISHISNAHIVKEDPGAEIFGVMMHIPLETK